MKNNWITIVANEEIMYSEFMVYIRWVNLTEIEDAVNQHLRFISLVMKKRSINNIIKDYYLFTVK